MGAESPPSLSPQHFESLHNQVFLKAFLSTYIIFSTLKFLCCETFSSWGAFCCRRNCNQSTHFSLLIPYAFSGVSKMVKKHKELWRALGTHVVIPLFTLQSFKMDRSWILVYIYHTQFLIFNSISIQPVFYNLPKPAENNILNFSVILFDFTMRTHTSQFWFFPNIMYEVCKA